MAKAKTQLKYDWQDYTPYQLNNGSLSDKQVHQEYQRLRRIALDRLDRLERSEFNSSFDIENKRKELLFLQDAPITLIRKSTMVLIN